MMESWLCCVSVSAWRYSDHVGRLSRLYQSSPSTEKTFTIKVVPVLGVTNITLPGLQSINLIMSFAIWKNALSKLGKLSGLTPSWLVEAHQ